MALCAGRVKCGHHENGKIKEKGDRSATQLRQLLAVRARTHWVAKRSEGADNSGQRRNDKGVARKQRRTGGQWLTGLKTRRYRSEETQDAGWKPALPR
jgi:hypothetical protein